MHGIRIYWNNLPAAGPRLEVPDGRSLFSWLFEPVLPATASLNWLATNWESTPFDFLSLPDDLEISHTMVFEVPEFELISAVLYRAGVLPAFASKIRNDWVNLFGFRAETASASGLAVTFNRILDSTRRFPTDQIAAFAEICFFCEDGFSWEMYASDSKLVDDLVRHLETLPGIYREKRFLHSRHSR